jgi:hypothetical protein
MLDKLKAFWQTIKDGVLAACAIAVIVLFVILDIKTKKIDALKARLALAKTTEEVDAIEKEIQEDMVTVSLNKQSIEEHQKLLDEVKQKRLQLTTTPASDQQVEDFWNK